ncbi:MAG: hypothetical protein NC548_57590 [Lachnospiraceae bacterium]|nr:hypothetical protein [Prevotella sp.]MCM1074116.1 hypothetical protein [Ruminococcus sp.]MCM1224103.1 hypothetical protein [Lachnospiraceae bacterium]
MLSIETTEFKVPRSSILQSALLTPTFRWAWIVSALLVCGGAAAAIFADWRWALVTAMLLLVSAPGVMALLYISYAMSPRCLSDAYPHTVSFNDEGFRVSAKIPPLPPLPGQEDDTPQKPKTLSFSAEYKDVKRVRVTLTELVIYLHGNPPGIVHIPYDNLASPREDTQTILLKCNHE